MIIDTNVAFRLVVNPTPGVEKFFRDEFIIAPHFLLIEMHNVLRKLHHFKGIPLEQILEFRDKSLQIIDAFYPDEKLLSKAFNLSLEINHPIYDCLFLALADLLNQPLVSQDQKLLKKCHKLYIQAINLKDI